MEQEYWGYIAAGVALVIAIIIALVAQIKVYYAYSKYSKVESGLNITGSQLVDKFCAETGVKIRSRKCNGTLTDNYDPKNKVLNISSKNYDGNSNSCATTACPAIEFPS